MTYPNWILNEANQIARRNKTTNAMSSEAKRIEYGTLKEALIINGEFDWLMSEFEHMLIGNYGEYAQFQIGRLLTESKAASTLTSMVYAVLRLSESNSVLCE